MIQQLLLFLLWLILTGTDDIGVVWSTERIEREEEGRRVHSECTSCTFKGYSFTFLQPWSITSTDNDFYSCFVDKVEIISWSTDLLIHREEILDKW